MHLISCRQTTSGAASFSHWVTVSIRAFTEFTFQVAIFMGEGRFDCRGRLGLNQLDCHPGQALRSTKCKGVRRAGTHTDTIQISKWIPDRAPCAMRHHHRGRVRDDNLWRNANVIGVKGWRR
ncbi:hypothetical protein GCM10008942_01670 [Rhizomicrobium electricum]|uniref:Uncharacterized protein n=1 Tax=Rhizomicrobium electricum TaxID=480070 RepID=A0ABP3P3Q6_9PROT